MKKLNIVTEPDERLHKPSKKVKLFDEKLKKFAMQMVETMREDGGVGLSAVQVGKLIRLVTIEYQPEKMDPESIDELKAREAVPLTILVNPKITKYSKEKHIACEGCLSLPGKEIPVERSSEVHVLAYDLNGNRVKIRARDFHARILQHELDHLDGILITDKNAEK